MSFIDWRLLPAVVPIVEAMIADHQALVDEASAALDLFSLSPEVYIQDPGDIRLLIYPVKWQGKMADQAVFEGDRAGAWKPRATGRQLVDHAPVLAGHAANPLIVNAMFSLSMPGCEILPHIDREEAIGEVLRLHVGLFVPEGDCALIVDGELRQWAAGQAMMFDSARVEHSAHNRTERPRLILIMDFDRAALTYSPA